MKLIEEIDFHFAALMENWASLPKVFKRQYSRFRYMFLSQSQPIGVGKKLSMMEDGGYVLKICSPYTKKKKTVLESEKDVLEDILANWEEQDFLIQNMHIETVRKLRVDLDHPLVSDYLKSKLIKSCGYEKGYVYINRRL